jgi:membrane-associated HD superfamily phosphohydrolase
MISGDLSLSQRTHLSFGRKLGVLFIALLFAAALAFVLGSFTILDSNRLEPGQVSSRTILAPDRVTYTSEIQTREAQSRAETQVKDVYDPVDPEIARNQVRQATAVLDYVDTVRHDPYSDVDTKIRWMQSVPNLNLPAQVISRS